VVVDDFLAAQAACPDPMVTATTTRMGVMGRRGIP
jgi:hypothetical protein